MLAKAKKRKDLKLEMCRKELAREQLEKRQKAIAVSARAFAFLVPRG